jgi:hypothetical protein
MEFSEMKLFLDKRRNLFVFERIQVDFISKES